MEDKVNREMRWVKRINATKFCTDAVDNVAGMTEQKKVQCINFLKNLAKDLNELDATILYELCSNSNSTERAREDEGERASIYQVDIWDTIGILESHIKLEAANQPPPPCSTSYL